MSTVNSILTPHSPQASTCGYCNAPGERNVKEASCDAHQLSCEAYQKMIDRGWRRSGTYCYKPDMRRTCCPQYTIKLDARAFRPSKSQRKLVNRWTHFILGKGDVDMGGAGDRGAPPAKKGKGAAPVFSLEEALHAPERAGADSAHRFEVTLEPSSFTEEKFALYQSYEANIHHKLEKARSSFKRFLVESPLGRLKMEPIAYPSAAPSHLPSHYGAYHQLYRVDGKLVGMGVIDILPSCVSSVYFMWEKEYEKHSLGKLSALREASLAREIHDAGVPQMQYLYMGYYIHTCPKMIYKGEYSPSYLADPEEWSWHPLAECRTLLDKNRYACFAHPERSIQDSMDVDVAETQDTPSEELMEQVSVLEIREGNGFLIPVTQTYYWTVQELRRDITALVKALGAELSREVMLYLQ